MKYYYLIVILFLDFDFLAPPRKDFLDKDFLDKDFLYLILILIIQHRYNNKLFYYNY